MSSAAGRSGGAGEDGSVPTGLPPADRSGLELRRLVKRYSAGEQEIAAVDRVSLAVAPGEVVAIYGPSGSGKSTLLMMAAALMRPDSGEVVFDGGEVGRLGARQAARYRGRVVGFISQEVHLIPHACALDNALIKLPPLGFTLSEARAQTMPWLVRMGLGSRARHTPEQLSMGERQRVAIARALAAEPKLLLADEPTGSLDSSRTREVFGLLAEICRERSMPGLIVTHDPEARAFVDRALTLRDGRIEEGRGRSPAPPAMGGVAL